MNVFCERNLKRRIIRLRGHKSIRVDCNRFYITTRKKLKMFNRSILLKLLIINGEAAEPAHHSNAQSELLLTYYYTIITLCPVPDRYNLRSGSCSSSKLVTLLANGNDPKHRTGKLHVLSSATSVNICSICS